MIAALYLLLALLALLGVDLARGLWAAATLLLVQRELGARWLGPALAGGTAGFVHSCVAGAWLATVVLWLGALTGTIPWLARLLIVATPLLALRLAGLPRPACRGRVLWIAIGVAIVAAPLVVQVLQPDTDWDGAVYHLPLARKLLAEGPLATDPHLLHHAFPAGVSLLYTPLLALGAGAGVVPFGFAHGVLLLLATHALARELYGARVAAVAVLVTASSWVIERVAVTPRADGFLALWCVVAVHATLRFARERHQPRHLLLAASALGLAVGAKYTGLLWLALLGPPLLVLGWRRQRRVLGLAALCILLPAGGWYLRNQLALGHPCYPFGGRLYETGAGARVPFEPAMAERFARAGGVPADHAALPANAAPQHMLDPWDLVRHGSRYDQALHWVSPLLLLWVLFPLLRRDRASLVFAALTLVAWLALAGTYPTTRLLLPVLPLASIGVAAALAAVPHGALLTVLLALPAVARPWRHELDLVRSQAPWRHWTGEEDAKAFVMRVGYSGARTQPALVRYVEAELAAGALAPDDAILMVGEDKHGWLPCRSLQDTSRDAFPWLVLFVRHGDDQDAILADLRARRVRAIFVNLSHVNHNLHTVPWNASDPLRRRDWLLFALHHLAAFGANHATRVPLDHGGILYRLKP